MIESQSIAVYALVSRVSMSFSVDETLLPRYVNLLLRRYLVKIPLNMEHKRLIKVQNYSRRIYIYIYI